MQHETSPSDTPARPEGYIPTNQAHEKGIQMAQAKVKELAKPNVLRSLDPKTGEVVFEVPSATPEQVREAVARAREAQPAWAALGVRRRADIVRSVGHQLHARMDEFVRTISAETGKPEAEALSHDMLASLLTFAYMSRIAPKALRTRTTGPLVAPLLGFHSTIEWRPFGVVGCISPWNYPVFLAFISVVPALLAGNAVVLKPSEVTPGSGELIREILDVLPEGVASVVQGGGDVGAALVDAPCDKICFVGSTATGRKIGAAAAQHLTPLVMELGGQDAAIVCEDADLDVATSGILWGAFVNTGQTCAAIERVYVQESVAERFKEQLVAKLRTLPEESLGPLSIGRQLDIVERHVADAVERGAKVLEGGPDGDRNGHDRGLWYAPTVLEGRSKDMAVFTEETFGPVLPIVSVKDDEEAIRRANEEGYNLTASVWTGDRRRGKAIAARLRSGTVSVNEHGVTSAGAPWGLWGGVGESGYGRLHGELGLREFAVPVHVATTMLPKMKKLWWYPYDQATTAALRGVADLVGSQGLGAKVKALRTIVPNALKAIRDKI
jgi:acyl-CoA reductase-like NAD-dependent aldehyde dehydrogenase